MPLNPMDSQLKKNIHLTVVAGAAATIGLNLTNPFFSLFVIRLGGTDYHVGWLSSLPALAAVLVLIPGGIYVDRFPYKKKITCLMIGSSKFFFLCLALVPFLPPLWQATIFVLLIGIMRIPGAISEIAWQSFLADYIPEDFRGYTLAQRSWISTFFGIIITLSAGQVLSRFPRTNLDRIRFYQIFFVIAFLAACYEVYSHLRIKEPNFDNESEQEKVLINQTPIIQRFKLLSSSFSTVPKAKRFLIFACCSIIFHFGWQMGWPLFSLYQIRHLHATEAWLSAISVISGLTSVLSYTSWNKFAEKHGNDLTLTLTGLGMSITPVLYILSKSLPILAIMNTIVGISTAGFVLTLTNMTLQEVPKLQRTLYIACYNTAINISAACTPLIGVYINDKAGIKIALLVAAFFRFLGVVAFFVRYRYYDKEKRLLAQLNPDAIDKIKTV